eukprot:GILJ01007476.1.p1 GENE.GILJ01007476.1~~GILJ01007476.1.p1  ORF type:complete len:543 (+),score=87.99 GILJ01007476.1:78-1706(+)
MFMSSELYSVALLLQSQGWWTRVLDDNEMLILEHALTSESNWKGLMNDSQLSLPMKSSLNGIKLEDAEATPVPRAALLDIAFKIRRVFFSRIADASHLHELAWPGLDLAQQQGEQQHLLGNVLATAESRFALLDEHESFVAEDEAVWYCPRRKRDPSLNGRQVKQEPVVIPLMGPNESLPRLVQPPPPSSCAYRTPCPPFQPNAVTDNIQVFNHITDVQHKLVEKASSSKLKLGAGSAISSTPLSVPHRSKPLCFPRAEHMGADLPHALLKNSVAVLFGAAGFERLRSSALEVATSVVEERLMEFGRLIQSQVDDSGGRVHSLAAIALNLQLFHCEDANKVKDYYKQDVLDRGMSLRNIEKTVCERLLRVNKNRSSASEQDEFLLDSEYVQSTLYPGKFKKSKGKMADAVAPKKKKKKKKKVDEDEEALLAAMFAEEDEVLAHGDADDYVAPKPKVKAKAVNRKRKLPPVTTSSEFDHIDTEDSTPSTTNSNPTVSTPSVGGKTIPARFVTAGKTVPPGIHLPGQHAGKTIPAHIQKKQKKK